MWYQIAFGNLSDSVLKPSGLDFGPNFLPKWPEFSKEIWDCNRYRAQRVAIFIQRPFQSPLEPLGKRFGINFGTILGAQIDDESIIDSIRSLSCETNYHISPLVCKFFPLYVSSRPWGKILSEAPSK